MKWKILSAFVVMVMALGWYSDHRRNALSNELLQERLSDSESQLADYKERLSSVVDIASNNALKINSLSKENQGWRNGCAKVLDKMANLIEENANLKADLIEQDGKSVDLLNQLDKVSSENSNRTIQSLSDSEEIKSLKTQRAVLLDGLNNAKSQVIVPTQPPITEATIHTWYPGMTTVDFH